MAGSQELLGDNYSPPDNPISPDEQEEGEHGVKGSLEGDRYGEVLSMS